MMFVNDTPSSIVLTEPHGEAELEVGLLAIALDVDAMPDSRCKGHIVSGCDLYILKVEHNRFCGRGEESLPSRHYRHLSRETKRAAVHRTSISLGHGQHVFPLDLRHARPLTSVRSVPGVPLHPLLPGLVVSYLPSLTAFHLDRHMLLGYALCWLGCNLM